jgi:alpha-glucosidase
LVVGIMLLGGIAGTVFAQAAPRQVTRPLTVASPNGALVVTLGIDGQLTWSVALRGGQILRPSRIAMTLDGGRILGEKPVVSRTAAR